MAFQSQKEKTQLYNFWVFSIDGIQLNSGNTVMMNKITFFPLPSVDGKSAPQPLH